MNNSDEPAKKKPRISINNTQDSFSELTDNKVSLTLSSDVTKILCTPHIQKRLNKLLQNTPDASPLTSILKVIEFVISLIVQRVTMIYNNYGNNNKNRLYNMHRVSCYFLK